MIYLEKATINLFQIQVVDMATIDDPIYLFRFIDEQRKKEYLIELDKTNPNNPRAGIFQLNLPTDLDMDSGKYELFIYQSDETGRVDWEDMPELTSVRAEVEKEYKTPTVYERSESTDVVYSLTS
tara:strand:- start:1286 stop:1660 length:375 start_codon:yes stop_codon:yes gene_type:complete